MKVRKHMPYTVFLLVGLVLVNLLLSLLPRLSSKRADVLIISPHPDDAVLCCAGVIQQAIKRGDNVHVIEMTDGTGYQAAAASASGKPVSELTPEDYLALGKQRRNEDITALSILGLTEKNITFLGYPDGWLDEVHKSDDAYPFTNPYTERSSTPETNRPYVKSSVIQDLSVVISTFKPQIIYIPDIADDALDHRIAGQFVLDVIEAGGKTDIFTYLVHRDIEATAPAKLSISLAQEEQNTKKKAIESYTTQLTLDFEYLMSFIKEKEIFY